MWSRMRRHTWIPCFLSRPSEIAPPDSGCARLGQWWAHWTWDVQEKPQTQTILHSGICLHYKNWFRNGTALIFVRHYVLLSLVVFLDVCHSLTHPSFPTCTSYIVTPASKSTSLNETTPSICMHLSSYTYKAPVSRLSIPAVAIVSRFLQSLSEFKLH